MIYLLYYFRQIILDNTAKKYIYAVHYMYYTMI